MKIPGFALLLSLAGCAPAAHLAAGSALLAGAQSPPRVAVASTLTPDDPLEAATCDVPTLPARACPAPEVEDHAHHHHHHQDAEPALVDGGIP